MRNLLFFIAIALLFTSCSEDFFSQTIDLDPPPYEKKFAAHVFGGSNDSIVSVLLSRNFGILETVDDTSYYVRDVKIEFLEEGQLILNMNSTADRLQQSASAQKIVAKGLFKAGKTYEMRLTHPDFPTSSAIQLMPQNVSTDSVVSKGYQQNNFGDNLVSVNVHLKDPAGVKNYYAIELSQLYYEIYINRDPLTGQVISIDTLGQATYQVYPESSDDPNAIAATNMILVSDQFFDGQSYRFNYKGYPSYYSSGEKPRLIAKVRAVTEDFYLYLLSAKKRSDSEDIPFAEPVPLYSNFKGGIGIFGLYQEQVFEVN